jgi:hypothetical protein
MERKLDSDNELILEEQVTHFRYAAGLLTQGHQRAIWNATMEQLMLAEPILIDEAPSRRQRVLGLCKSLIARSWRLLDRVLFS